MSFDLFLSHYLIFYPNSNFSILICILIS